MVFVYFEWIAVFGVEDPSLSLYGAGDFIQGQLSHLNDGVTAGQIGNWRLTNVGEDDVYTIQLGCVFSH